MVRGLPLPRGQRPRVLVHVLCGPLSFVTFGIATATIARYRGFTGTPERKLAAAGKRFALLAGIGIAIAVAFWWRGHLKDERHRAEEQQLLAFALNIPEVVDRIPGPHRASVATWRAWRSGDEPFQYEVDVYTSDPDAPKRGNASVIVAVARNADGPVFTVRCFPKLPLGSRTSQLDDCKQ